MMVKLSASIATLALVCVIPFLGREFLVFGHMELKAQLYVLFVSVYLLALAASGWLYVARRKLVFGIIHMVLMLVIAGLGIGGGVLAYCNRWHIAGGSGPDANPVAPVIFLAALAAAVVGIIAAMCAAGVIWQLFIARKK